MKRFLIPVVIFALLSCDNKPVKDPDAFVISDAIEENVSAITYDWSWSSNGYGNTEATFDIDEVEYGGGATAYSIINKTGRICDVYTYKNGKPDLDSTYRAWIITYSGEATKVTVKWSGRLIKVKGQGTATVETLFQVYGDWPLFANNTRPQYLSDEEIEQFETERNEKFVAERDSILVLLEDEELGEEDIEKLEEEIKNLEALNKALIEEARNRALIARYYDASVLLTPVISPSQPDESEEEGEEEEEIEEEEEEVMSLLIGAEGEYYFPVDEDDFPFPDRIYRMQLFTRIFSNDGKFNSQFDIIDGRLEISFE